MANTKQQRKTGGKKEHNDLMEKYNHFIKSLSLDSIYLLSYSFQRNEVVNLEKTQKLNVSGSANYDKFDGGYRVTQKYQLRARPEGSRQNSIKIGAQFVIIYGSDAELTEEVFKIFEQRNLPVNVWPFFRELVQNSVARAGLPPLTLPAFKTI